MSPRASEKRRVDGILLLDKPAGASSNRVLQKARRLFNARKAGHTGSLDPFATGMLPVCFGSATKVSAYLLESSKEYRVEATFGTATDTADLDGSVIAEAAVPSADVEAVTAVLSSFVGESQQIPPMYSALKHQGKRLYTLARAGIEVERPPRTIRIDWIRLEALDWPRLCFSVRCSKGTYVRSLAVDIAARLNSVAHLSALRRMAVDPFGAAPLVTLDQLEREAEHGPAALDCHLLGPDAALPALPRVCLDATGKANVLHGRVADASLPPDSAGLIRLYGSDGGFLGLGEIGPDRLVRPKRIFFADGVE